MPIFAYKCSCGKTADVLVRGREPADCDDVPELAGRCATPGTLSRVVTAAYLGRGGTTSRSSPEQPADCGHCGAPDSCEN